MIERSRGDNKDGRKESKEGAKDRGAMKRGGGTKEKEVDMGRERRNLERAAQTTSHSTKMCKMESLPF